MEFVWSVITFIGQAIEAVFGYVEHHHWVFAFLAGGYVFYLHDRSITRGSMRSTSASTKSASASPSNIDRTSETIC